MAKYKIVITDYQYESIKPQRDVVKAFPDAELIDLQCRTEEDVITLAGDADILLNQYAPMNERVINQLKNCKAIIRYGIGVDTVDLDAAARHGIWVCNVPDYGVDETSNQTIAMILAMARKLPVIHADVRRGNWGLSCGKPMHRFAGSTLGFVGLGRIATAVLKKLQPFSLKMIAYDPYLNPAKAQELGVELVSFEELLQRSDYVTIHCPATAQNRHMFNDAAFALMKPTAYLINCARGAIVDTNALITALQTGKIAGAALDVIEKEPIEKDNPLLEMDNVIIASHFGGYSEEAIVSLQTKAAQEAVNILAGNRPFNPVNAPVGKA